MSRRQRAWVLSDPRRLIVDLLAHVAPMATAVLHCSFRSILNYHPLPSVPNPFSRAELSQGDSQCDLLQATSPASPPPL